VADPQNLIAAPTMVGSMKVNPVLFRGIGLVSGVIQYLMCIDFRFLGDLNSLSELASIL